MKTQIYFSRLKETFFIIKMEIKKREKRKKYKREIILKSNLTKEIFDKVYCIIIREGFKILGSSIFSFFVFNKKLLTNFQYHGKMVSAYTVLFFCLRGTQSAIQCCSLHPFPHSRILTRLPCKAPTYP